MGFLSRRPTLRVANVHAHGRLAVTDNAPHSVAVNPGQRLRLRCDYAFRAHARLRETFEVRLDTQRDGAHPHGTTKAVNEGLLCRKRARGRIHRDVAFHEPGTHWLRWAVHATYHVRHRLSGMVLHVEREVARGRVRVDVAP